MFERKRPEALKSPMSSHTEANFVHNDINSHVTHVQPSTNGANYDVLTGSYIEAGQRMNARIPYHQPTSAMDGVPHEQEGFTPVRAAARVRRQSSLDDEPSSRAKMWDPVKDCSDPNTGEADLPGFSPAPDNSSERLTDSTISGVAPMGLHFCHGDHLYGQAQDNRQQFATRGASMGLLTYPQPHAMASGSQGSASMGSLPFQGGHPFDQFQGSRQHQSRYEGLTILPPHLRETSVQNGQQSLESITRGADLMGIQPHLPGCLHGHSQENGKEFKDMESRMPISMASHESGRPPRSSPSTSSNPSTQKSSDSQQANRLQRQDPSVSMFQAWSVARYAQSMDQQSNYTEAVRAYEQACVLLQELIIRSWSFEERMECNKARNIYQARLDVLSRVLAANQKHTLLEQDDQQEDDGQGGGKPQYSLFEDWALCHKDGEDLSWQEVAEKPMFKGKRKHRSLSQRKHTIGKMGPSYHEAEKPWTEEENRKLCALGDAGKTLGDIHRKFPFSQRRALSESILPFEGSQYHWQE
ncbi:hypothetical protein HO173_002222 [Letharia columbiana]|uniref:Uncharacterized protein n=1 Tax=Letharia columbiana TaxID=112416 RepID=A0A8H6L8H9_9LECA|nr:uncharacterized protein HO173_002222 [Letharia columbiana]KAF6239676.1 hypothetical protein HO173_002222 [Letharia columbiana]